MIKLIFTVKKDGTTKQTTTKVNDLSEASEQRIYQMLKSALVTWSKAERHAKKR